MGDNRDLVRAQLRGQAGAREVRLQEDVRLHRRVLLVVDAVRKVLAEAREETRLVAGAHLRRLELRRGAENGEQPLHLRFSRDGR